ncbi:universal stress protein [Rhodoferax sp.]|uniref:universal stress protein n=1 Tax=Rhodoferax sp. TaxID=50421 RepID=UPI002611E480|nr:universal stress protein [Rhodoferax sp.]MDD2917641.1 universal stress protein [Rhodoferax sp.]
MKTILIPVDGSECSLRSVNWVIAKRARYANPDNLIIHLVNVQAPFTHDISHFVSQDQIARFHREESEKQLQEARRLLDAAGAGYTCHLEVGKVAETITDLADALRCDEIVMGTHGRGALKEFLVGSIAMKIVHLSKLPVVLVK